MGRIALAIHGGAGTILKSQMTPALEAEYRGGLEHALGIGWKILSDDGSALDVVEATVRSLEDFPLFNAGRGSVFTHEGKQEMDASIMDGHTLKAGAVAFVRNIRNPVTLARCVMEKTEHVLLAGEGANQFAEQLGIATEPDEYFFTEHRWLQLQNALAAGRIDLDHAMSEPLGSAGGKTDNSARRRSSANRPPANPDGADLGTVGAVACDSKGHLAAATSTGGMTNKKYGRVGDTGIIGAGTYANDMCAVSCTGHGEFFQRGVTAYEVAARMKYGRMDVETAARETVAELAARAGEGGLIAVDAAGTVTLPFNSEGMYRGWLTDAGPAIEIYR